MILSDLLESADGSHAAVIIPEGGVRISYDELRRQVETVANALAGAGVRRGDRVALALPNGLPALVCCLAASVAGTAAPLNPAYREEEFRFYLDDTGARVLVVPT